MTETSALPKLTKGQRTGTGGIKYPNAMGWLLAASMVHMAILAGGSVALFINAPSAILVLGVSYFVGIAAHGWRDFNCSIKALLYAYRKRVPSSLGMIHIHIIRSMRVYVVLSGLLGFLVGLVQMLNNLDDPSKIGPALAVAILTVFYSVLLILLVFQPALSFLESRYSPDRMKGERNAD